jgi:hypothetical protein
MIPNTFITRASDTAAAIRPTRFAREKLCFLNADWLRRLAVWLAIFDALTITPDDCFPKKLPSPEIENI